MNESTTGRLHGKRVLITGTAGGQGAAAQALFAREGARVVGCDVQPDGAERSAASLREEGFDVTGDEVDLADPDAARAWIEESANRLGGLSSGVTFSTWSSTSFSTRPSQPGGTCETEEGPSSTRHRCRRSEGSLRSAKRLTPRRKAG